MMDEQQRVFLATIYGEAATCTPATWRAIASVILNRVGKREWRKFATPLQVISGSGFDAFTQGNNPYRSAYGALSKSEFSISEKSILGRLQAAVLPLYRHDEPVTTDAVLYYSPRAQAAMHAAKPGIYRALPRWNFDVLEPVAVPGAETDDFAFFRYRPEVVA